MIVPALQAIGLGNRSAFENMRRKFPPAISEHTFSNLFAWRALRPISLCMMEEAIIVVSEDDTGPRIFGPPLGPVSIGDAIPIVEKAAGKPLRAIERIPEEALKSVSLDGWTANGDPCNSDYVYRRQELARLEGRKFHSKRNLIAQCAADNSWAYGEISGDNIGEVARMMDRWCAAKNCAKDRGLCAEYAAIQEALQNYGRLGMIGAAIKIDGRIEAFTMAEELNKNTAVIHFEKASLQFKGLYQLINREFCRNALSGFEFVNREQDLCIEALKKTKRSYFPDHMVKKFTIRRAGDERARAKEEVHRCID